MENKDQNNSLSYEVESAGQEPASIGGVHAPPPSASGDLSLDLEAQAQELTIPQDQRRGQANLFLRLVRRADVLLLAFLLVGVAVVFATTHRNQQQNNSATTSAATRFGNVKIPLSDLISGKDLTLAGSANVTINGPIQLNDSLIVSPTLQPTGAKPGQIYYDQGNNQLAYFNGSQFVFLTSPSPITGLQSLGGATGQVALGGGLAITNNQLSSTGVLSVQGKNGAVNFAAGPGLLINGTTFSNTGILSVTAGNPNVIVTNDGNGNVRISVVGSGTGTVTSSGGTAGHVPLFTGSQNIENSIVTQSGLTVTINGDLSVVTGGLSLSNALTVPNGGTGATSLAANGVLVGQGTAAVTSVAAGSAGLCLLSTVGAPSWGACPSSNGVNSLNGLMGALNIANASAAGSTITIDNASTSAKGLASFNSTNFTTSNGAVNTAQNINTGATPTFAGVNTNNIIPSAALTVGVSGQTALLQGSTTTITSNGAGNNIVLNSAASIELQSNTNVTGNIATSGNVAVNGGNLTSSGALNITPGGALAVGASSQALTLQGGATTSLRATSGANTTVVAFTNPVANTTLNFPALGAGTYTVCTTSGNCAGAGVTLQAAYDNSTSPEIFLDATRGALTIRDNSTPIGANLLEVQNNAGSATYLAVTSSGVAVTGVATVSGNVNSTGGALQTNSVNRIDNSGNALNLGNVTLSGTISGGTSITGSGNINSTAGTLQTNSVTRIDNAGNLINIASLTASGNATFQGGGLTLGTATQAASIVLSDGSTNTGTLQTAALAQNTVYTLPDPGGASATICLTTGNCAGSGGGVTTPGGTTNKLAKFTGSQAIGDSSITDDGTNVTVSIKVIIQGGDLTLGTTTQKASMILHDGNGQTTTLQAGDSVANQTFILPTNTGSANQCLKQSGTGNQLVWQDCDGGLGGSSATLQQAYNNSSNPEIVLNSSVGGLTIRDNSTPLGANLFEIQNNAGSTTYLAVTVSGLSVTGATTSSGNINSSGGALQTNGTSRVDNSGNLINIGNITGSGPITIASVGAGNNVTINGANQFVVQNASVFNALSTFNADISVGANNITGTTGSINFSNFNIAGATGNVTAGTYNGQTISSSANFTGTVTAAGNLTLTGGNIAVNGGNITSSGALNITPGGTLTVGVTGQQLILQGNANTRLTATGGGFTTTVGFAGTPTANVTYNFDRSVATGTYTICTNIGNCAGSGGGVTTSGGTTGTLAKFTGSQTLGDSLLSESGTVVTVNGNINLSSGSQYRINGTQISSANLSNDSDIAKLSTSETFTGGTVAFQNGTNSTNAFNVQNAAGSRLLTVDTTNGQIVLGTSSAVSGKLIFNNVTNANTVSILPGTPTANRTLTLPDASGIICTDSGNCAGAGATLQTGYNFSVGGTTPKIKVNSTLLGVDIQDADTTIAANLFNVRASNAAGLGAVMFGVGNTGAVTLQNSANSTTALRLLSSGGTSVLTGDTTNGQIILGQSGTLNGTLVFNNATNSNTITIAATTTPTASRTIILPDSSGTICLTSGNCTGSGSANTLQAAYDAGNTITTSNARDISFTLADTATDSNFLVNLQCSVSCGSNGRFAVQKGGTDVLAVSPASGAITIQPTSDTATAFNMKTSLGNNMFTIDSANSRVGIGLGSSNLPTLGGSGGVEIKGGIRLSGASTAYSDKYVTPLSTQVNSLINIINYNPGAFSQLVAMGLPSTADSTARAISLFDARSSAHQPTLSVFSPDENQVGGFSWEGSNTNFTIKNTASTNSISLGSSFVNINGSGTNGAGGVLYFGATAGATYVGEQSSSDTDVLALSGKNGVKLYTGLAGGTQVASFDTTGTLALGGNGLFGGVNILNGSNAFGTSVVAATPSANRTITLPDADGTVCLQSSVNCGFAPATGSANYIQNQIAAAQTSSNFWISGTGIATTLQAGTFDTPSGTTTLAIGTTNATAINLNKATTITGALTQSGGTFSLTGSSTSSISTTSGPLTLQSVDANNNIVINGSSTTMTLNTGASGTITVGSANTTTVNVGAQTNNLRTINIGNPGATSQGQTVNIGAAVGTAAVTIKSGSGGNILTSTGSTIVKQSGTATATAFQVQNVAGTSTYFDVDALNGRVGVGTAAPGAQLDVVGQVPGSAYASVAASNLVYNVVTSGKYAYSANFAALQVWDITRPSAPVSLGTASTTNNGVSFVRVYGRYAINAVPTWDSIDIFDISNPASPVKLKNFTVSSINDIQVMGRYMYIATADGSNDLFVYDIINPSSPVLLGTFAQTNSIGNMAIQGRYMYATSGFGPSKLVVYDLNNPASPSQVGSVNGSAASSGWISVVGRYAFVASNTTLQSFNVSNPASPASAGTLAISGAATDISVQGRYAYISTDATSNVINVVDISNPASMSSVGTIASGTYIRGVSLQGRYLYGADYTNSALKVYDIGGTYTQGLEAGSVSASNVDINGSLKVAGSVNFSGGARLDGNFNLNGTLGLNGQQLIQTNSNNAFQIQNTSAQTMLNVDTNNSNIALLGGNSGSLGTWASATTLPASTYRAGAAAYNGYVYYVGGYDNTNALTTVLYSKVNSDGTLGSWTSTTALPDGRSSGAVTIANGYIYVVGGFANSTSLPTNTVYYARINTDGTVGTWNTTTTLPGATYKGTAVYANGYIYVVGGQDGSFTSKQTVYYGKVNADGTVSSWTTSANALPASNQRSLGTAVAANGYIYYMGGTDDTAIKTTVYFATLNATTGANGSWTAATNALPTGVRDATSVIVNGYVYVLGGNTATGNPGTPTRTVMYSRLNASTGQPGTWTSLANSTPTALYGASTTVVNGYIYYMGGTANSTVTGSYTNVTSYTSTARVQIGGSLDLIGVQGGQLSDGGDGLNGGSMGGSLTAGNGTFIGALQVQGQTSLASSLNVGGTLTVKDRALFQNGADSTSAVQVKNASGTTVLNVDTTNGRLGVGTTAPSRTVDVAINNATTTAPAFRLIQSGTGDSSVEFANGSGSFYMGLDTSAANAFSIGSSTSANGTTNSGGTTAHPGTLDSGNSNMISSTKVTAGASGTVSSISVYIGAVDSSNQHMQVGLYTDVGGTNALGTVLTSSPSQVLTPNSWNTFSVSASVTSGTTYWLAFNVDGGGTQYSYTTTGNTKWTAGGSTSFGTWPNNPTINQTDTTFGYDIYMSISSIGTPDTFTNKLLNLSQGGALTLQNVTDSSGALKVLNAAGVTQFAVDTGTSKVYVGDPTGANNTNLQVQGAATVSGLLTTGSFTGAGLTDCSSSNSKLLWSSSTKTFSCGTDRSSVSIRKSVDESVTSSATIQPDDQLTFSIGANDTYIIQMSLNVTFASTGGFKYQVSAPAGATCNVSSHGMDSTGGAEELINAGCGTNGAYGSSGTAYNPVINGTVVNGSTAGSVTLQWAQNASNATATTVKTGSSLLAYKVNGADLAEIYYTNDNNIEAGDVVQVDGSLKAGVKKTGQAYDPHALGVVSTKPGQVLGEGISSAGRPVVLALSGRIPVKVSAENGSIEPGDYLTTSSKPGVAMKATKPGQMIGKALESFSSNDPNATGTVMTFANLTYADPDTGITSNNTIQGSTSVSDLNVSGSITTKDLTVTNAANINILHVGSMSANDLTVQGDANFGGDINLQGVGLSRNAITKYFKASKAIAIGAVVIADPNNDGQVTTTVMAADTRVLGVALTEAKNAGDTIKVAIGGSVQVKVAPGEPIVGGDLLVSSSTEGAAQKATTLQAGTLIGKALGKPSNDMTWILISLQ